MLMVLRKTLQCSSVVLIPVNRSELTAQHCPEEDTVTFLVVLSVFCFPSNTPSSSGR